MPVSKPNSMPPSAPKVKMNALLSGKRVEKPRDSAASRSSIAFAAAFVAASATPATPVAQPFLSLYHFWPLHRLRRSPVPRMPSASIRVMPSSSLPCPFAVDGPRLPRGPSAACKVRLRLPEVARKQKRPGTTWNSHITIRKFHVTPGLASF